MKISSTISVCLALAFSLAQPEGQGHEEGLNNLMKANGKMFFGTATDYRYFNHERYVKILSNHQEWGQITPENSQKFASVQPSRGVYNFTAGDQIINWGRSHGYQTRCHNLIWHTANPEWLTSVKWTRDELLAIMEDHIKTVAMHYRGRCDTWDVVNEVVEEDGTLRKNIWHDTIGPEYIDLAFRYAAKYDPKAKLYYNDYGIEVRNQKSDGSIKLIRDLKSRGIPIHGVGFQCHIPIALPTTYEQFRDNLARFERLGVNLAVTELDSFLELPGTTEKYAAQAIVYANVAKACLVTRACIGVTTWNFYDPFSWVPGTVPGNGEAHLWWGNYTKKPAYYAIEELLNGKRVGS